MASALTRRTLLRTGSALAGAVTVGGSAGWVAARETLAGARTVQAESLLRPAIVLLKDCQRLRSELRANVDIAALLPDTSPDGSVLAAYLMLIRRDGVPRHAGSKQRLDQIASNDAARAALIAAYAPFARKPEFSTQAVRFQRYAAAWRDRWNSVMELFMAGGNYPTLEPIEPPELLNALQAEL